MYLDELACNFNQNATIDDGSCHVSRHIIYRNHCFAKVMNGMAKNILKVVHNIIIFPIQVFNSLLNNGFTPSDLLYSGVIVDSLYGKVYQDGIIYHKQIQYQYFWLV